MSHSFAPPPLPLGWVACQSSEGRTFYRNPQTGISQWEFPSFSHLPFAPHPSAPPPCFLPASLDAAAVDPELQPLTDALAALKIGVQSACASFAVSLSQEGVMSIDDMRLFSESEARDAMTRAGFKELQQRKLLQAVGHLQSASAPFEQSQASPSLGQTLLCSLGSKSIAVDKALCKKAGNVAAEFLKIIGFELAEARAAGCELPSLKAAGYDAAACRTDGCDWTAIRAAGFKAEEVKAAGCDFVTARAAGFDLPSLKAAGYDAAAFRAAGCDLATMKKDGFTAEEVKAAGWDVKSALSAGYDDISVVTAFSDEAVIASGVDLGMYFRDGSEVFMTLHRHKVDDRTHIKDGEQPLPVPAGWQIAEGNSNDARVCGAHPWQCMWLVMANGHAYGTAICDNAPYSGKDGGSGFLKADEQGVRSNPRMDILLKRSM